MLFRALQVEIEMKHLNLQETLLQKAVGTSFHAFPAHYTPADRSDANQ